MNVITPEEIAVLKKNPETAALGEKLEKEAEKWIPRSVFNEKNDEAKRVQAEYEKLRAEREAESQKSLAEQGQYKELAEKRARELEDARKILEAEKATADRFRAMENAKREELKKSLGDAWLSVYDTAPLDDLVKLEASVKPKSQPDGHRPGSRVEEKPWDKMTKAEREQKIADAMAGKLK